MPLTKAETQDIKSLLTKKGRKLHGMFLAEGIRLMEEALRFRFHPTTLYYAESLLTDRAKVLLTACRKAQIDTVDIPARQLETLADTETTQGLLGVFKIPSGDLAELYLSNCRRVLWCENISDPGNLGTLIRSALAFGFDLVVAGGLTSEPYAPKVVRSTAGAVFGITIARAEWSAMIPLLEKNHARVIAADVAGGQDIGRMKSIAARGPILLAVGSESQGLSPEVLSRADIRVRIRHSARVESLNAAVAGSILMNELYKATH